MNAQNGETALSAAHAACRCGILPGAPEGLALSVPQAVQAGAAIFRPFPRREGKENTV